MAFITTQNFAKDLWPGVNSWFGMKYDEHPELYSKIFKVEKSKMAWEEDVSTVGFGLAQEKSEGSGIQYDDAAQGYVFRYTHTVLALGFIVTREMHEDGLSVSKSLQRAEALAMSMRQTKEIRGANILNRAFNTSYTYGDSKELCASDLPNKSGGTWRNELETASDLSEAALEQACIDITSGFETDRGLKIYIMPEKLVIPPALQFTATRLLESTGQSGTANNDLNALKFKGMVKDVIVNPYLTDTDAWFILTNCPNGLKCYQRRPIEFGIDNDFDTENAKFKATERYSFGVSDKRSIFASEGAA